MANIATLADVTIRVAQPDTASRIVNIPEYALL